MTLVGAVVDNRLPGRGSVTDGGGAENALAPGSVSEENRCLLVASEPEARCDMMYGKAWGGLQKNSVGQLREGKSKAGIRLQQIDHEDEIERSCPSDKDNNTRTAARCTEDQHR